MRAFLAEIERDRQGEAGVRDVELASLAERCLPGDPSLTRHAHWSAASGRVRLHFWSNEPADVGGPGFRHATDIAVAATGYLFDSGGAAPLEVMAHATALERAQAAAAFGGIFAICVADDRSGTLEAFNTITRVEPVYWVHGDRGTVIGSRALLTHLAATGRTRPDYDLAALGAFVNAGYLANESTPFAGVSVLPPNHRLSTDGTRVSLSVLDASERATGTADVEPERIAALAGSLIDAFRPLQDAGGDLCCSLTGGKDSRLVVAALKRTGLQFEARTSGFDEHPDVVIARRVASELGIEHTSQPPLMSQADAGGVVTVDPLARAARVLFAADGMLSAYENLPSTQRFGTRPIIGGHGGELVRDAFGHRLRRQDVASVRAYFLTQQRHSSCLRPLPAQTFAAFLDGWVEEHASVLAPADVLDRFVLHYRCGRWSAAGRAGNSVSLPLYQPLFDNQLVKGLQVFRADLRLQERVLFALLEQLAPELVDVPFADDRWRFDAGKPRWRDRRRWARRILMLKRRPTRASFNWRAQMDGDLGAFFEGRLLGAGESFFSLVDREQLEGLLANRSARNANLLWNLLTVEVLLSDAWLGTPESHPIEIPVPAA